MMPLDAIRIINTSEDARWNLDQTVTKYYVVKFMVGTHGPFTDRFEQAGFTAQQRDARLLALARELWVEPPAHP
jgi:hypothetical protein